MEDISQFYKKIKVFFIDLDGTLLDSKTKHGHTISEKNIRAIRLAEKQGKHIVISTGRTGLNYSSYKEILKPKFSILANGAQIFVKNKLIYEAKLSIRQFLLLLDIAKKYKLSLKVDDQREAYGVFSFIGKIFAKKFKFYPNNNYNINNHKEYLKVTFWGKSRRKMQKILDIVKSKVPSISIATTGKGFVIEITHSKATKGQANFYVAKKILNIKNRDEMAHIGDSMNDATVVDYMPLIALKSGHHKLLKLADYHGPSYRNGGVAKVLHDKLIEKNKEK